uniref:Uncharacterized protein n=1 Tax=Anguilla anguilla TaxID=7936 RepID=A0A0E9SE12_ANGAN
MNNNYTVRWEAFMEFEEGEDVYFKRKNI